MWWPWFSHYRSIYIVEAFFTLPKNNFSYCYKHNNMYFLLSRPLIIVYCITILVIMCIIQNVFNAPATKGTLYNENEWWWCNYFKCDFYYTLLLIRCWEIRNWPCGCVEVQRGSIVHCQRLVIAAAEHEVPSELWIGEHFKGGVEQMIALFHCHQPCVLGARKIVFVWPIKQRHNLRFVQWLF